MEKQNQTNNGDIYYDSEYGKEYEPSDFTQLIGSPYATDRDAIVRTIYEARCLGRENTFFNRFREKLVHKAIESGDPSIAAEILDTDYLKAIKEADKLYIPLDRKFIGLYIRDFSNFEKPKLVAFSSFDGLQTIEHPDALPVVSVHDLYVVNNGHVREGNEDERINLVKIFYNFLLQSIEEEMGKAAEDTIIDFHTLGYDSYTWSVINERGYEVANGSENEDFMRFTKVVPGKGLGNEGNITR